jgi:SAM-dependent methyltransferase
MDYKDIRFAFVKLVYGDHNRSSSVQKALKYCYDQIKPGEEGLNVGAGKTHLHPQVKNLDLFAAPHIDYVGTAEAIPVNDNHFSVIITQETLEHVQDPFKAISEIYRVTKPGGLLYCQLPFIIGYHPGPTDFWRFTKEGMVELVQRVGFEVQELGISVGPSSGFYRIAVEYFSILFSFLIPPTYHLFKAFFAVLFYPLKWGDILLNHHKEADRIPGGYYIMAKKPIV